MNRPAPRRYQPQPAPRPQPRTNPRTRPQPQTRPQVQIVPTATPKQVPYVRRHLPSIHKYLSSGAFARISLNTLATLVILCGCIVAIIWSNAANAGINAEISVANNTIAAYQRRNMALSEEIGGRYTLDHVQYVASNHLGMTFPDASQIINIHVPRQSHVVLNTGTAQLHSQQPSGIRGLAANLRQRIFGGG